MDDTTPPVKKAAKKAPAKRAAKKPAAKPAAKPAVENDEIVENDTPEEPAANKAGDDKYLLHMKRGASYRASSGVVFTKTHPFQLVDSREKEELLGMPEERFEEASAEDAKLYYGNQ